MDSAAIEPLRRGDVVLCSSVPVVWADDDLERACQRQAERIAWRLAPYLSRSSCWWRLGPSLHYIADLMDPLAVRTQQWASERRASKANQLDADWTRWEHLWPSLVRTYVQRRLGLDRGPCVIITNRRRAQGLLSKVAGFPAAAAGSVFRPTTASHDPMYWLRCVRRPGGGHLEWRGEIQPLDYLER
ncbi:MAG TPA: hypothetical protein VLI05_03490 [Candidatus Saccharimonadia bacterium]|nr:hypothetical protein [Candidatus Saccharimonadia bacterium]